MTSQESGQGRRVVIALSPGGGNTVSIRFPKEADVKAIGLPGGAIPLPAMGDRDKPILRCTGRSCENLQIEVLLGNREPVQADLFSTRFGLPPEGRNLAAARPRNAIPQYAPDQTVTMSSSRF